MDLVEGETLREHMEKFYSDGMPASIAIKYVT
jgi:hypothetical protein